MAELRTEEEQLEAIKRWWKENGTSLIAGVAIAIAGVVGWNAWQNYQDNQAEAASMRYQHLINLADGGNVDEARSLVVEITDNHGRTLYADLARLIDARLAVEEGDLSEARQVLESVIESSGRDYVQGLARLRLARLQVADGDADGALETLARDVPAALAAQQADVRGDALRALGRDDEARQAWQEALAVAEQRNQPIYGVQLKLDDLGVEEATL
ncbi:tetratricopeptide repeat protein [Halomonas sp. MCCC 1A11036]|uniref:Ancillary SecYEG translocon subunit n=2 Tax=Billgrantia TaxID=3137761 RepID=A0A6I6SU35_9GAMM|nr:tetratricopeptide repeat protein [Halomonas tianxiuensis]MCE8020956.1 tetratricopeptide repeat protein [Halomonas zhangzhouensis]MCE8033842.1 tetratricopeptide repeat protein [Halomonas sp. MCCC 1A11057]MDX5434048.1 tetratricopeptide repeat protein [Halomonas sp.]QHC51397.1 tetratricopeptide repeat protein [Halomonas tianxiuensis]